MADLKRIREAFRDGTYLLTEHVLARLLERNIDLNDVSKAIVHGQCEVLEDYADDRPGPSCLILTRGETGLAYHMVCSYEPAVWVITVYVPDPSRWSPDLRRRVEP